jgi:hypothetical protein
MCIHCLYHIHPPTPFSAISPFPLVPTTSPQPVPPSCRRKDIKDKTRNMTFC